MTLLLAALPALRNPTVAHLAIADWVAIETIINEKVVREIIPQLTSLGADGIIKYPLHKLVHQFMSQRAAGLCCTA